LSKKRMASSDLYKITESLIGLLCRIHTLSHLSKSSLIDSLASIGSPNSIFDGDITMSE
jgi:hypothetical protein